MVELRGPVEPVSPGVVTVGSLFPIHRQPVPPPLRPEPGEGFERLGVCRPLDQHAVHRGDPPRRLPLDQSPRGPQAQQVDVDAAAVLRLSEPVLQEPPLQSGFESVFGHEHPASRRLETGRPGGSGVTVQPPDALQQHVHRTQVRDQQVGVDVERLLERLRADDQRAPCARSVLPEGGFDRVVESVPVLGAEPAVVQRGDAFDLQQDVVGALPQGGVEHRLGAGDRVPDHQDSGARVRRGHGARGDRAGVAEHSLGDDRDGPADLGVSDPLRPVCAAAGEGQRRIGCLRRFVERRTVRPLAVRHET